MNTPPAMRRAEELAAGPRPEVLRPLDSCEAILATHARYQALQSAHLAVIEGPLDAALLTRALQRVQRRHPILNARLETQARGYRFVPGPVVEGPWRVVAGVAPPDRAGHVEEALNTPLTEEDALPWRVTLLQAPAGDRVHAIILSAHPALMDGAGALRVIEDVLSACADVLGGVPDRETPHPAVAPLDTLIRAVTRRERLRRRGRDVLRGLSRRRAPAAYPFEGVAALTERRTGVVLREVPADVLGPLVAEAQRRQTTLEGVFTVLAVDGLTALFGDRGPVDVSAQLDLRGHCTPAVPPTHVGCFATATVTQHSPHDRRDLWLRAREVSDTLQRRAKARELLVGLAAESARIGALDRRIALLAANPELQGRTGLLCLTGGGALRTAQHGPFRLRALYASASLQILGPLLRLSFASVDDTLFCTLSHPRPLISDRTARTFLHDLVRRLAGLAPRVREAS